MGKLLLGICGVGAMAVAGTVRAEPPRAFPSAEGFDLGVNYWASHAGMYMWRNWDGAQVERDLDRLAAERAGVRRRVRRDDPRLGLTEHAAADGRLYAVAVNSSPEAVSVPLEIDGRVARTWGGAYADGVLALGANEGCVLEVEVR